MQYQMALVEHPIQGASVGQRASDGYINATAMCRAAGKRWSDYWRLPAAKEFVTELSAVVHIHTTDLVQTNTGGEPRLQGTWVHPDIAIHLAQWLSARFAVQVAQWVREWLSGGRTRSNGSYHLRRYTSNIQNVPYGHWSMLQEMMIQLIGPMEARGYVLPENLLPDISEGRMFCKFLRDQHGLDTDALPTYEHTFEDGRLVRPKAYPNVLLPSFRAHLFEVWMPQKAMSYFESRDPVALEYLPYLLPKPEAA